MGILAKPFCFVLNGNYWGWSRELGTGPGDYSWNLEASGGLTFLLSGSLALSLLPGLPWVFLFI